MRGMRFIILVVAMAAMISTVCLGVSMLLNAQLKFVAPLVMVGAFALSASVSVVCMTISRIWRFIDARKAHREAQS